VVVAIFMQRVAAVIYIRQMAAAILRVLAVAAISGTLLRFFIRGFPWSGDTLRLDPQRPRNLHVSRTNPLLLLLAKVTTAIRKRAIGQVTAAAIYTLPAVAVLSTTEAVVTSMREHIVFASLCDGGIIKFR
jgi:hypothetical protein